MVSFEGNTGPYLLYARARLNSIFERAKEKGADPSLAERAPLDVAEPAEKDLALALLRYPATVRSVAESLEPSRLCAYLYELAVAFSRFYDRCHVLNAPEEATRLSRLRLCGLTRRVLTDGLETLGLPMVERM